MTGGEAPVGGAPLRAVPDAGETETKKAAGGGQTLPIAADERLAARIARADRYFKEHLEGQRGWYSRKASRHKRSSQWLSLAVIFCGALITFVQVFSGGVATWPWLIPVVTAALGAVVALLTGIQRIWKFDETWVAYRRASEQMKREYRLYINDAGGYGGIADEDEAYRRFVENTEAIIAEEQQLYWQSRAEGTPKGAAAEEPKPTA